MKDIDGTVVVFATAFGTKGFATIQPGQNSLEEQISFTGITQNANGTATLTGVHSVTFLYPYTEVSGLLKTHAGSTELIISNTSGFYNELVSKDDDETINGIWTFATGATPLITDQPTTNLQAANKLYVDTVAIAGAPDASTTTKGITKLDTAPVSPTNPIAVGSNSPLIVPTGTSGGIIGFTSTTARSSSVLLTQHALVIGGGAGATPTPLASLGTTTTVLHGNASGDPTYGAVVLTTDVSGILPVANGGQISFTNGTTTKNAADGTSVQNIAHGLGRIPKYVRVSASIQSAGTSPFSLNALAVYNGTTQSSYSIYGDGQGAGHTASGAVFRITTGGQNAGAAYLEGVITFDITNIIITWTLTVAAAGNYQILWEAQG